MLCQQTGEFLIGINACLDMCYCNNICSSAGGDDKVHFPDHVAGMNLGEFSNGSVQRFDLDGDGSLFEADDVPIALVGMDQFCVGFKSLFVADGFQHPDLGFIQISEQGMVIFFRQHQCCSR